MKKIVSILSLLLLCSTMAFAKEDNKVKIAEGITNGTVTYSIEDQAVTLTVTPAEGYYLTDITATKIVDASNLARTRGDDSESIPVLGDYTLTKTSQLPDRSKESIYTLTLSEGLGAYVTATFAACTPITADMVTLEATAFTYTGEMIMPKVTVKVGEKTLVENTDYGVDYSSNNNNAAKATDGDNAPVVIVAGMDTYSGELNINFTINKAELTVTTGSGSKQYDGTALTNSTASVSGFVNGETATVSATGSQTDAGTSKNTYSIEWGTAEASNYTITEDLGTLTVTAATVTITAASDSKVYDGTALTKNSYTNTALVTGDAIESVTVTGSQTDVGTCDNEPSAAVIKNAAGEDVTTNYAITYANGTLEVTAATLTITATDYNGTYDGEPHTIELTIPEVEGATVKYRKTASGEYNLDTAPTYTDVVTNAIVYYQVSKKNYSPVTGEAKVTIKKAELTIIADDGRKVYNGEALTKNSYTHTDLATGDAIESVTITGSRTEVGKSDNEPSAAVIKNSDGDDVTGNYAITYANGTLEVIPAIVTVRKGITATRTSSSLKGVNICIISFNAEKAVFKGVVKGESIGITGFADIDGKEIPVGMESIDIKYEGTSLTGETAGNYVLDTKKSQKSANITQVNSDMTDENGIQTTTTSSIFYEENGTVVEKTTTKKTDAAGKEVSKTESSKTTYTNGDDESVMFMKNADGSTVSKEASDKITIDGGRQSERKVIETNSKGNITCTSSEKTTTNDQGILIARENNSTQVKEDGTSVEEQSRMAKTDKGTEEKYTRTEKDEQGEITYQKDQEKTTDNEGNGMISSTEMLLLADAADLDGSASSGEELAADEQGHEAGDGVPGIEEPAAEEPEAGEQQGPEAGKEDSEDDDSGSVDDSGGVDNSGGKADDPGGKADDSAPKADDSAAKGKGEWYWLQEYQNYKLKEVVDGQIAFQEGDKTKFAIAENSSYNSQGEETEKSTSLTAKEQSTKETDDYKGAREKGDTDNAKKAKGVALKDSKKLAVAKQLKGNKFAAYYAGLGESCIYAYSGDVSVANELDRDHAKKSRRRASGDERIVPEGYIEIESGKEYEVLRDCPVILTFFTVDGPIEVTKIAITEFVPTPGDANGDGQVNAADLVEMVKAMNGQASDRFFMKNADMDGDKTITKADIDAVRKLIMGE